jgi:hypothetical protein
MVYGGRGGIVYGLHAGVLYGWHGGVAYGCRNGRVCVRARLCRGDEGSVSLYPVAYVCVYVWRMGV